MLNPTLACANRLCLKEDIQLLERLEVPMFHLDVMDGHYVPNLCFDMDTITQIAQVTKVPLDIHLMVDQPEQYIPQLNTICPEYISFHLDQSNTPFRLINEIKKGGSKAGIVLNPKEQPEELSLLLNDVQLVTVMGVEPGFSGQTFMPQTVAKIEQLARLREQAHAEFLISVDGGINLKAGEECLRAGADVLVVGALAIFNQKDGIKISYRTFEVLEEKIHRRKNT